VFRGTFSQHDRVLILHHAGQALGLVPVTRRKRAGRDVVHVLCEAVRML
jgi:hypothetical protein